MRPEYSTGMSHPPKSTIFAPVRRWTAFKAVLRSPVFSSAVGLNSVSLLQFGRRCPERGGQPLKVTCCMGRVNARSLSSRSHALENDLGSGTLTFFALTFLSSSATRKTLHASIQIQRCRFH